MSRLDHLLARNLGISRTAVKALMKEGRVTDAGGQPLGAGAQPCDNRRQGVASSEPPSIVRVDGAPISLFEDVLALLHKPCGTVTALRDARHPTAYALLRDAPLFSELRPVGRLDLDTSGLLLWTTQGALVQRLTHPKRRVPRTYEAALAGAFARPSPGFALEDGHIPEIVQLAPLAREDLHPATPRPPGAEHFASITVIGGAYHEIRRIFVALGSHVLGLCRTRFGDHALPLDLPPGAWRRIEQSPVGTGPGPRVNEVV